MRFLLLCLFAAFLVAVAVADLHGFPSRFTRANPELLMRAKRQYCLNYPCPPGSSAYVPNWGGSSSYWWG
ncbi:hypothetical protein L596_021675 [Steinernema carpocapsae]|uniref:Uncharacterized protein n=1 Tax=Steinernema carpocapsae TaxID=34508 RepID=A0A4U5MJF6_STECR|nr:hypothetical protein L596_021675 [Steinernema carpocapsae]